MNNWDTPFDESMIGKGIAICCHEKQNAEELMTILSAHGAQWVDGESLSYNTNFGKYNPTVYFLDEEKTLSFGDVECADFEWNKNKIKCTFYGYGAGNDFEPAGDDELLGLLRAK